MGYTIDMGVIQENLAYLAGLLDGEGTIAIDRSTPRGKRTSWQHNLKVSITNTNLAVLEWVHSFTGIGSITSEIRPGQKDCHRWQVGSNPQSGEFLQAIRPWLRIKSVQCWLALEFLAQRTSRNTGGVERRIVPEEIALRDGFYWALREVNS